MNDKRTKDEKFEDIYESCADDVYRVCLHMTMNEDLAQEIAQQAFVNFYEHMHRLDLTYAKAYVIRSAKNLLYNYYRDTKKECKSEEENEDAQTIDWITESVEEQYFADMKREMAGELTEKILLDLQENHKAWYEIIYMMFFMEMNHDDIAKKLEITKVVLYSRLHRAKLWIRKHYQKEFEKMKDKA